MEPLRIVPVLEVSHEVVSKPCQIRLSLTRRFDLLLEPEIKNMVQVDIAANAYLFPSSGWQRLDACCGDATTVLEEPKGPPRFGRGFDSHRPLQLTY